MKNEEFFQSKRIFTLAVLHILEHNEDVTLKSLLKTIFDESTLSLLPKNPTNESLRYTLMNLKEEEVKFK